MPRIGSNSRPMQARILHMSTDRPEFKLIRSVGFWLAVAMSALQGLNAVRTFFDPVGFASYMGVPINGTEQVAWVQIYGLRAAFISLLVAVLIIRQDIMDGDHSLGNAPRRCMACFPSWGTAVDCRTTHGDGRFSYLGILLSWTSGKAAGPSRR